MRFAFAPVKYKLDPVRLAGAMYAQRLQRDAQAKAEEQAKAQRAGSQLNRMGYALSWAFQCSPKVVIIGKYVAI